MSSDREVWPVESVRDRDLIESLRAHGEHAVSYSFHKSRELSRDAAYEIVRLQARVERLEGAVQHNLDCVHAREARVEALEAAIADAMHCLNEHDPEVAAICRAATEQETE